MEYEFKCTAGEVLPGDFVVVKPIGEGAYGTVCTAVKDDRQVAVKVQPAIINAFIELALLKTLNHPGIIKPIKLFVTTTPALLYIYQPLGVVRLNTYDHSRSILVTIYYLLSALGYLQRHGLAHADIKPGNIVFLDNGHPAIIDFGLVQFIPGYERLSETLSNDPTRRFRVQTPQYRAPEMWNDEPFDSRIDVFSLGATIYEWLTGTRLFATMDNLISKETFFNMLPGVPAKIMQLHESTFMKTLLSQMLTPTRRARPFATELAERVRLYILGSWTPPAPGTPAPGTPGDATATDAELTALLTPITGTPPDWPYPYPIKAPRGTITDINELTRSIQALSLTIDRISTKRAPVTPPPPVPAPDPARHFMVDMIMTALKDNHLWLGVGTAVTGSDLAWVILTLELTDRLLQMVADRREDRLNSFIPSVRAAKITKLIRTRAIRLALYLLTTSNSFIDLPDADYGSTMGTIYEYVTYTKAFVIPMTLITTSTDDRVWYTEDEYNQSWVGQATPVYSKLIETIEWPTLARDVAMTKLTTLVPIVSKPPPVAPTGQQYVRVLDLDD